MLIDFLFREWREIIIIKFDLELGGSKWLGKVITPWIRNEIVNGFGLNSYRYSEGICNNPFVIVPLCNRNLALSESTAVHI